MIKKGLFIVFLILIFSSGFVFAQGGTEVSSVLIKATVSKDDSIIKSINIKDTNGGKFDLRIVSVLGVSLKEKSFILGPEEEKKLEVNFDSKEVDVGTHIGFIEINGPSDSSKIPVIFEVESKDVFFDANIDIPPVYTEIERGSKIVYQVKVFDLTAGGGLQEGLGPESVEVEYVVSDLEGSVLITRAEQLVVNKQSQVTNTITFPKEVQAGDYVLSAVVKYKTSTGISSQTFSIKEPTKSSGLGIDFQDYGILIVAGTALLVFFGVIVLFIYLLRERDRIFVELKKYNSREIREIKELLREQQKVISKKKIVDDRVVRSEINTKIKKLRMKQAKRVSQMRNMKSKGLSVEYMRRKLEHWKTEGYNLSPIEYKVKSLSTNEMQKILSKWKKKYALPIKKKEKPKIIKRKKNSKRKR